MDTYIFKEQFRDVGCSGIQMAFLQESAHNKLLICSSSIGFIMFLFVTVGSTGFDALIQQTTSSDFLNSLSEVGIKKVVYQFGASEQVFANSLQFYQGKVLDLDGYKYKASIAEDMEQADIIISHAGTRLRLPWQPFHDTKLHLWCISGAGTILQALRMENKKLIVVVNESLMDNHQHQLAQAMHSSNYAICSDIRYDRSCSLKDTTSDPFNFRYSELTNTLKNINHIQLTPFPAAKPETFASIVDEQMGFALWINFMSNRHWIHILPFFPKRSHKRECLNNEDTSV